MEHSRYDRPRISRETRLLLTAALLAIATLWVLARIRFPDRPPSPNPVTPLLSQLAISPKFDDLAAEILELESRLGPSLLPLAVPSRGVEAGDRRNPGATAALRVRDDLAVAVLEPGTHESIASGWNTVVQDPGSGLTLVRVSDGRSAGAPVPWTPRRLQEPRYLVASDASLQTISLRPVFIGGLDPVESPAWSQPIWLLPSRTDVAPGAFVFSSTGELAGVVVSQSGAMAIVPAEALLADVERLLGQQQPPAGEVGIRVQRLTADVARAAGATAGVVVTWVDAKGAAASRVRAADVIEAVDGQPVRSPEHWAALVGRRSAGDTLSLRVRSGGETRDVPVVVSARVAEPASRALGLTLRTQPQIGAEVLAVERSTAADRAGLTPGDVITAIGSTQTPTAAQVRMAFAAAPEGEAVLVAFARGDSHRVIALEK